MALRGPIAKKLKGLEIIDVTKFSESEWQALRSSLVQRNMVGGSDVGTIMGLNKWKSPINLYYQMVGVSSLPDKMNLDMAMGKLQEDNIAESWQYYDESDEIFVDNLVNNRKPRKYAKLKATVINPKYPNLLANTDGIIVNHPVFKKQLGVLEIKKANGIAIDAYEMGYPPSYFAQCQHYMLVLGLEFAELCMRVDGKRLNVHLFEADKSFQDLMLDSIESFLTLVRSAKEAIEDGMSEDEKIQIASYFEPDADDSKAFDAFISEKHKAREEEITIQGTDEHEEWARTHQDLSGQIKSLESEKQLFQNRLKQVMEKDGATNLILPNGKITWRRNFSIKL